MKRLLCLAAIAAAFTSASADTSYLLVQGPFGLSGSTETLKWQVNYNPGQIDTGFDLLTAVFGPAVDTGQKIGATSIFRSGDAQNGVTFQYYPSFSAYVTIGFTLRGVSVLAGPAGDPGWNYYGEGGTGDFGSYPAGVWTFSDDGMSNRHVGPLSFDGWVYGSTDYMNSATIANGTTTNAPAVSAFANATVVNLIPEPGSALLLLAGVVMLARRR